MEFYYDTMTVADQEVSRCLETPKCHVEAVIGCFTITDLVLAKSPKIADRYMGDGHRCTSFPCPICHPGRSQLAVVQPHAPQASPVIFFGDGGHTCRKFPCPICNNGRSAALQVQVGC